MPTVLLVEPNESLLEVARRHLDEFLPTVEVEPAATAARARAVLTTTRCAVVVVAWDLPDGRARTLLAAAAALDRAPVPIVTAHESVSLEEMRPFAGATWLLKPYDLVELQASVERALGAHANQVRRLKPHRGAPSVG